MSRLLSRIGKRANQLKKPMLMLAILGGIGYWVYQNPPVEQISNGEIGIRTNIFTSNSTQWKSGAVIVIPIIHDFKKFSLKDRVLQFSDIAAADNKGALQSLEGLSIGANITIRYNLDEAIVLKNNAVLPSDDQQIVESAFYGIVYKVFAKYTVREIFSNKREEIISKLETELKSQLASDGLVLKGIQLGSIDLPDDYRKGMEALLAEEIASEKMRYTIELKKKQLEIQELAAKSEAREQIIAAQAQEEAMKHVIPFKQRQIEQRKLEAEATSAARIKEAQGNAQARLIEAEGEAAARKKLAESDAYRIEQIGKANVAQMAKEGELISKHPMLIQKAMADKLSDKVQVIIAPPSTTGFVGDNLIGGGSR